MKKNVKFRFKFVLHTTAQASKVIRGVTFFEPKRCFFQKNFYFKVFFEPKRCFFQNFFYLKVFF